MIGTYLKTFLLLLCLSLIAPAYADTQGKQSHILPTLDYLYDEDFCDFQIKFPTQPKIKDISSPETGGLKATSLSFLKVFGIEKSIRVIASCKEITKEIRRTITKTSIDEELSAIEKKENIKTLSKTGKGIPKERLRIGSLSGYRRNTIGLGIYIYQIWITDSSVFTIEAEINGPEHPDTDKLLVAILQSFERKNTP